VTEELKPANRSEAIGDLAKALATAQGAFPPIPKSKVNPRLGNAYATLDDIISTTRKALSENALAVMQTIEGLNVVTVLVHGSGQWQSTKTPIMVSNITNKETGRSVLTAAQEFGSALTYSRRYGLAALLNVAADDDDDANSAGEKGKTAATRKAEPTASQDATTAPKPSSVPQTTGETKGEAVSKGKCSHGVEFQLKKGAKGEFWAASHKLDDGTWCKDRPTSPLPAKPGFMTAAQAGRLKVAVGDMDAAAIKLLLDAYHVDKAAQLTEAEAEKLIAELIFRGQDDPDDLFETMAAEEPK